MNDKDKRYEFHVELEDGQQVQWVNLTRRQAESMCKWTSDHVQDKNLREWGWSEMKEGV